MQIFTVLRNIFLGLSIAFLLVVSFGACGEATSPQGGSLQIPTVAPTQKPTPTPKLPPLANKCTLDQNQVVCETQSQPINGHTLTHCAQTQTAVTQGNVSINIFSCGSNKSPYIVTTWDGTNFAVYDVPTIPCRIPLGGGKTYTISNR